MRFDSSRVTRALEHLARALHFLYFGREWPGVVEVFPNFSLFGPDTNADQEFRRMWRRIIESSATAMAQLPRIGENQEAFYYQVMPTDGAPGVIMRATFYGGATVTIGFLRPEV